MKTRIVLIALICLWGVDAFACMHAKIGETVEQNRFRIALAYKDGVQTTAIQPNISVKKATDLGWLFPVPKLPKSIEVGDTKMLVELGDYFFASPIPRAMTKGKKSIKPEKDLAIVVHPTLDVGPFKVTPIEGGYDGVAGWLKKNKYQPVPKDHLKPYLDKGFVILAAKVEAKAAGEKVDLPPIIIQFESPTIQFPLMFERTDTITDFEFYLFTTQPFPASTLDSLYDPLDNTEPYAVFASRTRSLRVASTKPRDLVEPLGAHMAKLGFSSEDTVYVERMRYGAVSHANAVKKNIPDLALPVPSETDDIKEALTQLKDPEPKEAVKEAPTEKTPAEATPKEATPTDVDVKPASCMTGGGVHHARLACLMVFLLVIARRRKD